MQFVCECFESRLTVEEWTCAISTSCSYGSSDDNTCLYTGPLFAMLTKKAMRWAQQSGFIRNVCPFSALRWISCKLCVPVWMNSKGDKHCLCVEKGQPRENKIIRPLYPCNTKSSLAMNVTSLGRYIEFAWSVHCVTQHHFVFISSKKRMILPPPPVYWSPSSMRKPFLFALERHQWMFHPVHSTYMYSKYC